MRRKATHYKKKPKPNRTLRSLERRRTRHAEWRAKNPGYHRAWTLRNPDYYPTYHAKYRAENRETIRAYNTAYQARRRARLRAESESRKLNP